MQKAEYIREDYPETGDVRECWVSVDAGIRCTLEVCTDGKGVPVLKWAYDTVPDEGLWEVQGLMPLSEEGARRMIAALARAIRESWTEALE